MDMNRFKIADGRVIFLVLANKLGGSMNASFGHAYEDFVFRNLELSKSIRMALSSGKKECYPTVPNLI
jgi:hypothetical protein